jgi:minor curlin subunit
MSRFPKARTAALSAVLPLIAAVSAPAAAQTADIPQIDDVPGGVSSVLQNGDGNDATVKQLAVQSGFAPAQNSALITQSGDGNSAEIGQEGSANTALIAQNGNGNAGVILQNNAGNAAELQQHGNGLSIKIEQFGAAIPGSAPLIVTQGN